MMKHLNRLGFAALCLVAIAAKADDEAKTIDASDTAAVAAAKDTEATIQGKLEKVEWSKSGKVCNFTFENATGFMAVTFERSKDKLDKAFGGDFTRQLTGAVVKINGKVAAYGGHDKKYTDAMQIIIKDTNQITVVTPASQPATTEPAQ